MEEEVWQYHSWRLLFPSHVFTAKSLQLTAEVFEYFDKDCVTSPCNEEGLYEFVQELDAALADVGGRGVVPKLNWKVPQDATWMYKWPCTSAEQVLMMLKASDITRDELQLLKEIEKPPVLNVIRYHPLKDGMTFRGFVFNKVLVGLCQKSQGADQVAELAMTKTKSFFTSVIKPKFPQDNYTFDIYIDMAPQHKIWLMDFGPWSFSDFLGFSPEELEVAQDCLWREQSTFNDFFSSHRVPDEVTDGDWSALVTSLQLK